MSDAGTAFDAVERGNYKLAVRYYTRALWSGELSDVEAAAVYFGRAFAYIKLEDYAKAEEDRLTGFLKDVDVLIMDSQYTAEEYAQHVGWGHGCVDDVVRLALAANVKHLFLFHHDPDHSDGDISAMEKHARKLVKEAGIPVLIGGLSSVYSCDEIGKAGAEALGRDVHHGLQPMAQGLS